MAYQNDPAASKEDQIKSCFITREGTYKLMTLSEYSRPNRVPLNPGTSNNVGTAPVRVSFLTVQPGKGDQNDSRANSPDAGANFTARNRQTNYSGDNEPQLNRNGYGERLPDNFGGGRATLEEFSEGDGSRVAADSNDPSQFCPDRICFNVGRELYVYHYRGVRNAADLTKPIDKRVYKGTYPTCHDFNEEEASSASCSLIIGFSAGQIQLIDPFRKECQISKLYNEDRLIDKTRVTCLKWVPGTPKQFLSSHSSGQLYLYNEDAPCSPGAPAYQLFKSGQGYAIYTCKMKSSRNPMYRWQIGEGPINEFSFSPDNKLLATVSQDGFMRIFNYHSMELVGHMRSYFGGLLCVSWSPDGKYIVTGGEDDLVTVYSVQEKRIVCRGHGHRSWISQVAFDPYTTWLGEGLPASAGVPVDLGSEEDLRPSSFGGGSAFKAGGAGSWSFRSGMSGSGSQTGGVLRRGNKTSVSSASLGCVCYRFGSVGHDTQLCLWDLTEDVLKNPAARHRSSTLFPQSPLAPNNLIGAGGHADGGHQGTSAVSPTESASEQLSGSKEQASGGKKHKRGFSLTARLGGSSNSERGSGSGSKANRGDHGSSDKDSHKNNTKEDPSLKLLGTPVCPRLDEVPLIEPLICKKIAHERLTVLAFREDCIVTACQEGFICTWARPGKAGLSHQQSINSPNPGGSPNLLPGGTIV